MRQFLLRLSLSLAILLSGLAAAPAAAQPPGPAPALGDHLSPDGSLNTAGLSGSLDASGYTMRLAADGEPIFTAAAGDEHWDDRFGAPGIGGRVVRALAVGPDGSLYIGGAIEGIPGVPAQGIARWDGRRWHALGTGIAYPQTVRGIAVSGANVYVVGDFTSAGGVAAKGVARWNGTSWAKVGSGAGPLVQKAYYSNPGSIEAVAVAPDGEIYVGGEFNRIDGVAANGVARWDGAAWSAVGGGVYSGEPDDPNWSFVSALAFAPDGTLFVGGMFDIAAGEPARNVAAWDGAVWSTLGGGLSGNGLDTVVSALLFHGGRLYAGGYFSEAGGQSATNIAAWDGDSWAALGDGLFDDSAGDQTVLALMADGAGLIAAGRFSSAGGQPIGRLARWDGAGWARVGAAGHGVENDALTQVWALAPARGGGFYIGGDLQMEDGSDVNQVARWTGSYWSALGQGVALAEDGPANLDAIAVDAAGRVYVGGLINYVGGKPVNKIAMWDGTRWHDLGGGVVGSDANVFALLVVGDDLYVGGRFSQAGGVAAGGIAKWSISGRRWSALGSGTDGNVRALAYGGGKLYAGGDFSVAGGVEALEVAVWDGARWSGLGGEFEIFEILDTGAQINTYVNALSYVKGELYIGGRFQTIHRRGTPRTSGGSFTAVHNIVSYDTARPGWYIVGPQVHPGVTTNGFSNIFVAVRSMAYVGGGLYVGGDFNRAGGVQANNFARYDLAGNSWTAVGNIAGPGGELTVRAVTAYGPDVFVGGTFTSIGGTAARYVARYNTVAKRWSTLGSGMRWYNDEYTQVHAIAVAPGGVYVGGEFDYAGPHPSLGLARWSGALDPQSPPDPVDPGDGPGENPGEQPTQYRLYLPLLRR